MADDARPRRRLPFAVSLGLVALAALGLRWGWIVVAKTDLLADRPVAGRVLANADCDGVPGDPPTCDEPPRGDAIYYTAQADVIADGRWFEHPFQSGPDGRPEQAADHAPLTALALAPASMVGGDDTLLEQRMLMSLYGTAAVVLVGLVGRRVAGDAAGLWSAALAAVYPNLWMNDVVIMSETFAALGTAAVLLALLRFADRPGLRRAVEVGLACGVTVLARAELGMLLPLVFAPICWRRRDASGARAAVRDRVAPFAVAGAVAVAVAAPWTVYNLTRFAEPVLFSTNDGLTLIGANCPDTYDGPGIGFWSLQCADFEALPPGLDQSEESRELRAQAVEFVRANTDRVPAVVAARVARVWGVYQPEQMVWFNVGEGREATASRAGVVTWWLVAPTALAGAVVLRRRGVAVWPFAATAVAVTVTAVLFYGIVRFRVPAEVAAVVLAGVAIETAVRGARAAAARWRGTAIDPSGDAPRAADDGAPASDAATVSGLDGYRAVGVTMVLVLHAAFATGFDKREPSIGRYLARLDVGVALFFVLSAFLLFRPMAAALLDGRHPVRPGRFWRRRLLRILPAYWAALVGLSLTLGLPHLEPHQWFVNAFALQGVGVNVPYAIGQAWTIGVEAGFYLVLPGFAVWCHRALGRRDPDATDSHRRARWLVGAAAAWWVGATALRAALVLTEPDWAQRAFFWFPLYADWFAIGLAAAVLAAARDRGRPLPRPVAWLADHGGWSVAAGVAVFAAIAQLDPPPQPFQLAEGEYLARQFAYGTAAMLWLVPTLLGPADRRLPRALAWRPLAWVGSISFGVYLWHVGFITQAQRWTVDGYDDLDGLAVFTGNVVAVGAVAWICAVAVAALQAKSVERPFLRAKALPLLVALDPRRSTRHAVRDARRRPAPEPAPRAAP